MFSLKIVDTDAFLEMPLSTQALYFHLAMRADDDGFVSNPRKITRMLGSQEDELKVLFSKKFIIPFESGVCVIKHWKIHNYIQSDRYSTTQWIKEKELLVIDDKTQKYSLNKGDNKMDTEWIQNASSGKVRVRLGKDRLELGKNTYTEFQNVKLSKEEYEKLKEKLGSEADVLIEELGSYLASSNKRYSSHYATLLNWSRRKKAENYKKTKNITTI